MPAPNPPQVQGKPSAKIYKARYVPRARIVINGLADEPAWSRARVEKHFIFPWSNKPAPATEFRALCDDESLYFMFDVKDEDIVVLEKLRDEQDVVLEDRVELLFSRDDRMEDYYCAEIDPRGRVLDYRGVYYRRFDMKWNWAGLEARGATGKHGYVVEGRIPLESLVKLGFPRLRPGVRVRMGLYRAEFSHDRSGRAVVQRETIHNQGRKMDGPPPIEEWMSWIDPGTEEPDFHVPGSLGWLEIVRESE